MLLLLLKFSKAQMSKHRNEAQIEELREEIMEDILAAERMRLLGLEWNSQYEQFQRRHMRDAVDMAKYMLQAAMGKVEWLISLMSLPAAPIEESLTAQAKSLEKRAAMLTARAEKMNTLAAGLRECAKNS